MSSSLCSAAFIAGFVLVGPALSAPIVVYSNSPAPGDRVAGEDWEAIGGSGWYYNAVADGSVVGITTGNPKDGNGSVYLETSSRADRAQIEYLPGGDLGSLAHLVGMSFDGYRDGASTVANLFFPAMRVIVGDQDGNRIGNLVFERVYNVAVSDRPVPTDAWLTMNIDKNTSLWGQAGLATNPWSLKSLAAWQDELGGYSILGFRVQGGGGWDGKFTGYVDNISWTIGDETTTTNFEVIPLPAGIWLMGAALGGLALMRRKVA